MGERDGLYTFAWPVGNLLVVGFEQGLEMRYRICRSMDPSH